MSIGPFRASNIIGPILSWAHGCRPSFEAGPTGSGLGPFQLMHYNELPIIDYLMVGELTFINASVTSSNLYWALCDEVKCCSSKNLTLSIFCRGWFSLGCLREVFPQRETGEHLQHGDDFRRQLQK